MLGFPEIHLSLKRVINKKKYKNPIFALVQFRNVYGLVCVFQLNLELGTIHNRRGIHRQERIYNAEF